MHIGWEEFVCEESANPIVPMFFTAKELQI